MHLANERADPEGTRNEDIHGDEPGGSKRVRPKHEGSNKGIQNPRKVSLQH
jgi:hypothetical protein